jgi:hypothetical protein
MSHFYNKHYFSLIQKRSSLLQRWRCTCKFKSGMYVGSAPEHGERNNGIFYRKIFAGGGVTRLTIKRRR